MSEEEIYKHLMDSQKQLNFEVHVVANMACFDSTPYLGTTYPYTYERCLEVGYRRANQLRRLKKVMGLVDITKTNRGRRAWSIFFGLRDSFLRLPKDLRVMFCPDFDELIRWEN